MSPRVSRRGFLMALGCVPLAALVVKAKPQPSVLMFNGRPILFDRFASTQVYYMVSPARERRRRNAITMGLPPDF